jgi:L-2,4-diaminobutyrate decarboxylase
MDTFAIKDQEMTEESFRAALLRHNAYNRKIYEYVRDEAMAGRGVGEAVTALKSFILSPFTDEANVEKVVEKVLEARAKVAV